MQDIIVESLDSLLTINDELSGVDHEMETFLRSVEKKLLELDPEFDYHVTIKHNNMPLDQAISQFSWDDARYPKSNKYVAEVFQRINGKFEDVRKNLKDKTDEYNEKKEELKQEMKDELCLVDSERLKPL